MTSDLTGARPEWVSGELFPFQSRFLEVDGNVVHYIDEGSGPTVLMYHGNPTWSLLYRTVIAELRDGFRCVAFDYPGFGLSIPAPDYGFTVREHMSVSRALVDMLGLDRITAFVQDWGGPIGLGVASLEPERYDALVIGNTFAWPADKVSWKFLSAVMGGAVGRLAIDRGNFLARTVGSMHRLRRLTAEETAHYTAPFPGAEERRRTRIFISQIRGAEDYLTALSERLPRLGHLPALFLWGDRDAFYKEEDLRRLEKVFADHQTRVLEGAGHFIQSEAGPEIAASIRDWHPTALGQVAE